MIEIEQLEISRLDAAGQVIRRIRCLAGRVTVFRANSPELLECYHKAFEGVRQTERFSMLLDSTTFKPHEHHLIGFGERFGDSKQESVSEYLEQSGVRSDQIEQLLLDHGLGGLSGAPCADLSTSQERIVRILAATASTDKVMILNDPFEIVPDQWREKLALLIVNYAWKKRAIVVVTKLTYRPQEWIENEIIARIQLERPRQRTIGFGGEGFNAAELIQTVRQQFGAGATAEQPEKPAVKAPLPPPVEARPPPNPQAPKVDLLKIPSSMGRGEKLVSQALAFGKIEPVQARSFGWGLAVSLCLSVIMITGLLAYGQLELYSRPVPISKADLDPELPKKNNTGVTPVTVTETPRRPSVLDNYPSYIRDAVLQAFTDPGAQIALSTSTISTTMPSKVIEQANFAYPAAEETYQAPENFEASPQINEEEMERRREEIRQRFLEAIQAQSMAGQ